jgi:hypothetical protein
VSGKWRRFTSWSIVAATAALIGWDIVVATNNETGDTISEVLLDASRKRPIIAAALGIVIGHLFWPQGHK